MNREPGRGSGGDGSLPGHELDAREADQAASIRDQTSAEADQTASDNDQTASDADQTASDRDQLQAASDERASQRDQLASDRDLAQHPTEASHRAHQISQIERERSGLERQATALTRAQIAEARDRQAVRRESEARSRDETAATRDRTADNRDLQIFEGARGSGGPREERLQEAVEAAAELRSHAAADRARAASDRERAAVDREESALDRRQLYAALQAAHLDDLTGAYRRGIGEMVLRNELERAQRGERRLTLAVIDADDLKGLNDARGHAAGDALLRDVATTVRATLRPDDPLVRIGGDEFVCTIADSDIGGSRRRVAEIALALALVQPDASISVGLAEMRAEDTLEDLIGRADEALYEEKRS